MNNKIGAVISEPIQILSKVFFQKDLFYPYLPTLRLAAEMGDTRLCKLFTPSKISEISVILQKLLHSYEDFDIWRNYLVYRELWWGMNAIKSELSTAAFQRKVALLDEPHLKINEILHSGKELREREENFIIYNVCNRCIQGIEATAHLAVIIKAY
ncbi:MAG: hypothetical protein NUV82_04595 [Candidatus Komeilibacteria bacterium]|nr:hypothetical protein [Candidatus Komeilibacteria bacterium]